MSDTTISLSIPVGDQPGTPPPSPGVTPPVVARDDLWTVDSASTLGGKQTQESLTAALAEPTTLEAAAEAPAAAPETLPAEAKADEAAKAEAAPTEPEKPAPAKRDRIGRLQAEVHQLTRAKYETRADLEQAEQRLTALRQEITALEARKAGQPPPADAPAAPSAPAAAAPVPEDMPLWEAYEAQGKAWDEYAKDYRVWLRRDVAGELARELEQREQAVQAKQQQAAEFDAKAAAEAAYQAQLEAITEADPTFPDRAREVLAQHTYDPQQPDFRMDVVREHAAGPTVLKHWVDHPEELASLTRLNDQLTHAMMIAVRHEDDPVPLLSYLATHPQETEAIARLPRERALLALGAITTRLERAVQAAPAPVAPQMTRAAAPIRPVGGTRTTGDSVDLYDLPIERFLEERQRREAAARRRP